MKVVTWHYERSTIAGVPRCRPDQGVTMDAAHDPLAHGGSRAGEEVPPAGIPETPSVPGFTHRFIDTPGLRSHVAITGEGEPVVMLHGFPEHWWQWRTIGAGVGRRYRVICPDLRGAGWTRAASPRIGRLTQMDDLLAVLDSLGIERVRVVAHDMGALTALHLAYAHPERVRAMVVLSVPPPFMPFSLGMLPAVRHVPRFLFHRRGRSIAHIFEPPYVVTPMASETVATYLAPMQRPEIDAAISALYRGLVVPEMMRIASGSYRRMRLRVPSLFAFGTQDEPLTPSFVRRHCGDTARYADHVEIGRAHV